MTGLYLILPQMKQFIGGVTYEYVDLGLPSGLKWAKCNVGAEKETDYGDYFQWGSTTPNTDTPCDWEHAPFNNGSSSYNETYFNSVKDDVCPNGILAKEYDAAAQIMGGNWRMPTNADLQEMIGHTSVGWVKDFNGSGVNGWQFVSQADTSKYIFMPAAGYRSDSSNDQNISVNIWTSSLNVSQPSEAQYLNADFEDLYTFSDPRYRGHSVRGVFK